MPSPHSLSPVSAFPRGDGKSFGGFSGVLSRGERGRGSFPCELPAGASFSPILRFSSRCFVGVVGVRAFKLLQDDGCVDS